MMMGFGGFGLLFMLLFFVIIIGLAVWLVSVLFPRVGGPASYTTVNPPGNQPSLPEAKMQESALDILKRRYARGELSKAEYEAMREDILAT
ncbi:MAG: SHOCT domain-containing protein [Chloroflexota bacterium]|nr:SHOCT domain-containing protein [Chloroflexota bacterium]